MNIDHWYCCITLLHCHAQKKELTYMDWYGSSQVVCLSMSFFVNNEGKKQLYYNKNDIAKHIFKTFQ